MQKVTITAELTFDRACDLTKHFASEGFDVSAKTEGKNWIIAAMKDDEIKLDCNQKMFEPKIHTQTLAG